MDDVIIHPGGATSAEGRRFDAPGHGPQSWQPLDAARLRVWARLSPATRRTRFDKGIRRLDAIREIARRPAGESERGAIARVVTWGHRSSVRRWQARFEQAGFEGLLPWNVGPASAMPAEVRTVICTLVRADPDISVEAVVAHVGQFHDFETSTTKVKRILCEEGLNRPRGPRPGGPAPEVRLELGGAKLLEAAAVRTGYLEVLTKGIVEHVKGLERPLLALPRDTGDRDELGRFTSAYNERFRKGDGDDIGPGFASVQIKREFKDPDHLQISHVSPEVIERKLMALWYSPLLGSGRWDGIRVSRGQLLDELCGHAYMPATLERFTAELKYAGVADTLWEIHARRWLELTSHWGERRMAGVLFVDGTTKPVWTRLFAQSTKVSSVGRTMPGLEVVALHSGYGVPLWMSTHSGRAPLVRQVPKVLAQLEATWGDSSVGRIVVIDAEANSIPFLQGLQADGRAFVTRLRPSMVQGKPITDRNNFRAYRNGDRVRSGVAHFNNPQAPKGSPKRTFSMRVVEIERRGTGKLTYLGASTLLDDNEWKPQDLADLYFSRWPAQEADFRAVNQALGSKQVHGYGKQLVTNVSVVTKLDELEQRVARADDLLQRQRAEAEDRRKRLADDERVLTRRQRRQQTVGRKVAEQIVPGRGVTLTAEELVREQAQLAEEVAERKEAVQASRQQLQAQQAKVERTGKRLARYADEQQELESRRSIFAHDVETDSLLSLLKVGLVLLARLVLRDWLGDARMAPVTFLDRLVTLPARLLTTPQLEIVTFEHNTRDPEVMGLLRAHVDDINDLRLVTRSGRRLEIRVESPPKPRRPPPPGSRAGSGDRFKR